MQFKITFSKNAHLSPGRPGIRGTALDFNLCPMSLENMYELEPLVEWLEQKGLITKKEILTLTTGLKRQHPPADSTAPSQERFTETENAVIEELMAVILQHGLSADQARKLLGRTIQLLEWGKQARRMRGLRRMSRLSAYDPKRTLGYYAYDCENVPFWPRF